MFGTKIFAGKDGFSTESVRALRNPGGPHGSMRRLPGFSAAAPSPAESRGRFEHPAEASGLPSESAVGSQRLGSSWRRPRRPRENSGAAQNSRSALRRFPRLAESSSDSQNLSARGRILRWLPESSAERQKIAAASRIFEHDAEPSSEAPKIPGFRRIFWRAPEDSRESWIFLGSAASFRESLESSGRRRNLPRDGRRFYAGL